MTDRVTVSRDKTRLLPPNSPEKGWRITRKEAAALGLVESEEKPAQTRRVPKAASNGTPQKRRSSNKGLNRGLNEDA